ncbi:hypothetical protein P5G61_02860 [Paenibacillus sp. F6_3S_P_1C]|uniref:Uncharacterized protein n=1 Tax=Paenibacillus vandeheii TaxID=3035917 RepID=A0ABT8J505_9BACL|nr:hypothetical protein [Paenibacillus vandeheii]MDN4600156.1 hypothetical protein [Paenibacillus vandeheii]
MNTSKELKDIAMRFKKADADMVSLGSAIGAMGAPAMMKTSGSNSGSGDKGYRMAQVNMFGKLMWMPVNENGVSDQAALQAYQRDQGHLDYNRMQAVNAEPPGEDIVAMQIKAFEKGIHPYTGEPVSDKYAQMMLTSLKFSQLFMGFQMVRGSMPGSKGPFRLPSSHPAVAKIKKNVEASEARHAKTQSPNVIGEVKLQPLGTKGEGDALKRTFELDGTKVEINSGHGYRGSGHRTGNAQDIGTMNQIESVILKDMQLANKTNIDFPRPPKTVERTIQVNEKTMGYTVTQTPDGTLRVSTYYPK